MPENSESEPSPFTDDDSGAPAEPDAAPAEQPETPEEDSFEEHALGQTATVINNFFDQVDGSHSVFGVGTPRSAESMTGVMTPAEVDKALTCFVKPPGFEDAVEALREHHVLVLVGVEDIGKRTGAIALLDRVKEAGEKIIVLSPAPRLGEQVSRVPFTAGRGYFIHGWIDDGRSPDLQRFELDRLSQKLRSCRTHLVITLNRQAARGSLSKYHVAWQQPDLTALFDAHLGTRQVSDEIAEVRQKVEELSTPRAIAVLARQIAAGDCSPVDLLADLSGDAVAAWFDDKPKRADVHMVAALAFAYGLPERVFERLVVSLESVAEEVRLRGREPASPVGNEDLPQTRAQWSRDQHQLVKTELPPGQAFGERAVVFRGSRHREQVIKELVDRYDYQLWEPLRLWIRQLADDQPEVQVQAAAGLAILAAASPQEVRGSFLEPWAAGRWPERLTASMLLSMMCADDTLAPFALATALNWVDGAGQAQAMTAAMAFAGGLSIRYLPDSVDWLWFLSFRSQRIRAIALRSLVLLFQSAAEREGRALKALLLLARHVELDMEGGMDPEQIRSALAAVLAVLECGRLETPDEPMASWLLVTEPTSARPLGVLWAWTLRNAYHRGNAIRALCRVLRALEGHQNASAAASDLGKAIWSNMPEDVAKIIKPAVRHAVHSDQYSSQRTRELVLTMTAGDSRNLPPRRYPS
ncbi:hypothetical protein ABZ897_07770 [Nonomuraea sp. NPDC046802]|uniref:hypothetical protein n=1 Tax=Nonomuraea sp. NPDC046802 TaxID=3154919 RepID=UPI0033CC2A19